MYYQHRTTGALYRLDMLVTSESDLRPFAVYTSLATGAVLTRPASEFFDGRFEVVIPVADEQPGPEETKH